MSSKTMQPRLVQEYVGVPEAISAEARALADELGIAASEVLREMILAGRTDGLERLRKRAAEFTPVSSGRA